MTVYPFVGYDIELHCERLAYPIPPGTWDSRGVNSWKYII